MSRIAIINKNINKNININILKSRGLLFYTSIIKFKVTISLLNYGIRTRRIIIIRVIKIVRVL